MKRIFKTIIASVLILTLASVGMLNGYAATKYHRFEGKGYTTPEKAVEAYVDAMREWDVEGMISTFAIETYVDNVDARTAVEYHGGFADYRYETVPSSNEYARNLLISRRYGYLIDVIYLQYTEHQGQEFELSDIGRDENITGASDAEGFNDYMNIMTAAGFPEELKKAKILRFSDVDTMLKDYQLEELYDSYYREYSMERILETLARLYGYDEVCDVPVFLRLGDEDYVLFMECARYGDKWYNLSPQGILSSLFNLSQSMGGLIAVDELEDNL